MAAFKVGVFTALRQSIDGLLAHDRRTKASEAEALAELQLHHEALARPLAFRQRDDNVDLTALARHTALEHPRLANDLLICLVDEVSRNLRLHQQDSCALVEHALDLTQDVREIPRVAARVFYNECHHLVLCLHDLALNLTASTPDRCSIAFFAMIGGQGFPKALLNALGTVLTDLTGGQAGDEACVAHAGAMIPLLVEALLAFSFTFKVTAEDVELTLSLLPHVVMPGHAPAGLGFTISDLDLILREEHADVGIILCLALICMCQPADGKLDISRVPSNVPPSDINPSELRAVGDQGILSSSQLGARMREAPSADNTGYWNEESQLGQFLCFAISGVLLDEDRALRNGYVHWHIFHFIQNEILLSPSISAGTTRSSLLVFVCLHNILSQALLPVGRRWVAIKKLEAQAVAYRLVAADSLQLAVLRTLNRLCRAYPPACDTFRDVIVHCTDTFHLSLPQVSLTDLSALEVQRRFQDGSWMGPTAPTLDPADPPVWMGAPPTAAGMTSTPLSTSYYDNTALYAEILDLLATTCGRGQIACARHMCQRLVSHSNQWFNWGFLVDTIAYAARATSVWSGGAVAASGSEVRGRYAPVVLVAVLHLISGVCNGRLRLSEPAPVLIAQAIQAVGPTSSSQAGTLGTLLLDLCAAHGDPLVKAASVAALAHLDWQTTEARTAFASLVSIVPTVLPSLSDVRTTGDMALAVEFLACAISLAQSVPLRRGRHGLDLQAISHVVVHYILLKLLADPHSGSTSARYWRLASLTLRWFRLVLRGPISLAGVTFTSGVVSETYADSEAAAMELVDRSRVSSATEFMFRSLLSLDSPVLAHVLYLTVLQGHGILALSRRRQANAGQPFMQQAVTVGLDVIRLLLQRDTLFLRLRGVQAADLVTAQVTPVDDTNLIPCHLLLFSEFRFSYPPPERESTSALLAENPFLARRLWHSPTLPAEGIAMDGGRTNPSYLMLLTEFIGAAGSNPTLSKLALYVFTQCAVRAPKQVHAMLQLEPWRLKYLCTDLHDCILNLEEDPEAATLAQQPTGEWSSEMEQIFTYEAAEVVAPVDAARRPSPHLDVTSFLTCLPCCFSVDLAQQLADDALVEKVDLDVWARSFAKQGASADEQYFEAAHFRGLTLPLDWLLPPSPGGATAESGPPPPAPLAVMTCRLVALRAFALLLNSRTTLAATSGTSAELLCQVLLGFAASDSVSGGMDVDVGRLGQNLPIAATMELLDNPPELPLQSVGSKTSANSSSLKPDHWLATSGQAIEEHDAYELALGILLGLFTSPASREASLVQMWYKWPSRYQVLYRFLSVDWATLSHPLRHTLLAECCLLLRVLSWEMRLVRPLGLPPPATAESAAAKRQLITKRAIAELLADSVSGFLITSGEEPFLITTLRELLEVSVAEDDAHPNLVPYSIRHWKETAVGGTLGKLTLKAFADFVASILHHFMHAGVGEVARIQDPRRQAMRAHLEALIPILQPSGNAPSKSTLGLEVSAKLCALFVVVMHKMEVAAPMTFKNALFSTLQAATAIKNDDAAFDAQRQAQQALLLLLQLAMPSIWEDSACSPLPDLVEGQWLKLVDLFIEVLRAVHAPIHAHADPTILVQLRFAATCAVAAAMCRAPPLAATIFESGGLSSMLHPLYLQVSRTHFTPLGLPPLDTPHPGALLAVLHTVTAVAAALPAHRLALQSIVTWLVQHQRTIIDLAQWVSRLPVGLDSEPRLLSSDGFDALPGKDLGSVLRSAARVKTATPLKGPQQVPEGCLLLLCASGSSVQDEVSEQLAALAFSGRCWQVGQEARSISGSDRDQVVALCYRCVAAFAELWATLCSAAQRWVELPGLQSRWATMVAGGIGPGLRSLILSLEPAFEEILSEVLLRNATVAKPRGGPLPAEMDLRVDIQSMLPKVEGDFGLYPEESVRLRVTAHVLHAWRCDSITQTLQMHTTGQLRAPNGAMMMMPIQPVPIGPGSMEWANANLIALARTRVSILGAVFVRSCSDLLLGLHFAPAASSSTMPSGEDPRGSPCLQFLHSRGHFRHLLHIIEVSLHLLQLYVRAILQLSYSPQPEPIVVAGAPRTAVVVQHLQALRQFSAAVSGSIALAEQADQQSYPLVAQHVDLAFVAEWAQLVEALISGM